MNSLRRERSCAILLKKNKLANYRTLRLKGLIAISKKIKDAEKHNSHYTDN
jgi:hypothetical protein